MPRRNAITIWHGALFRGAQAILRIKNEHARERRIFNLWSDAIADTLAVRLKGRDRHIAQSYWWRLNPTARITRMRDGDRSFEKFKMIIQESSAALSTHRETHDRTSL